MWIVAVLPYLRKATPVWFVLSVTDAEMNDSLMRRALSLDILRTSGAMTPSTIAVVGLVYWLPLGGALYFGAFCLFCALLVVLWL